ncbi:MAG TPA: ABC-F family ATP-binding cassette domain-containing protein [Anaerolineae bacterium]|nr:ABC-F family ATP-binding cassette domain-containing protein [Anaerolineae bacterium]
MLLVSNISKKYGARTLFPNVSFTLYPGDRLGIVGENGTGKTTLLEIIVGKIEHDSGEIYLQKGATIGYLEQNLSFESDDNILTAVMNSENSIQRLEHKRQLIHTNLAETHNTKEQDILLKELGEIEAHYERAGGYTIEYEAKKILAGLGFSEQDIYRKATEISGGWLMRAGLAKLLLSEPDLLFLDEPTNHLDIDAVVWLESFITDYAGAVAIISHDRAFLNTTATKILAMSPGRTKQYKGNYDAYCAAHEKDIEIVKATIKNQERFIESETRFIERFRAKNTKAAQVQSRIKRLEKLEPITKERASKKMRVTIPGSPRSGKVVVKLDRISFGYDSILLYHNLDLSLLRGEKVALVGSNGAGKTTLLKLLAGMLNPTNGACEYGHNVSTVFYAQYQEEQLLPENTVLAEIRRAAISETDEQLRTRLGSFLFSGDDVSKKVSVLSGGEKARLALAKLFLHPANFILMDEPTNHLDIPSRDILANAISAYDGTLCFVTHDRDLINRTADKIIEIINGSVSVYNGNYSDYIDHKSRLALFVDPLPDNSDTSKRKAADKERKHREGELRNQFHRESKSRKKRVSTIDKEMYTIDTRLKEIEYILVNPASCEDQKTFNEILTEYEVLKNRKEVIEEEWLIVQEEIEGIRVRIWEESHKND